MAIKIVLVEDNPSLRKRFLENFKYFQNIELIFIAPSGEAFLEKMDQLVEEDLPNVVLMDIELPGISGIEATYKFKQKYPNVDVIMLTIFDDSEKIARAIQNGAVGYILKDESPSKIVRAIEDAVAGGAPMTSKVARSLVNGIHQHKKPPTAKELFQLSEKELIIVEHLVNGKNYNEMADIMILSPHTVKTHIKNVYKKMKVHTRAEVVKVAMDNQLIN